MGFIGSFVEKIRPDSTLTDALGYCLASIPPDVVLIGFAILVVYIFVRGCFSLKEVKKYSHLLLEESQRIEKCDSLDLGEVGKQLPALRLLIEEYKELTTENGCNVQNCELILSEDNIYRSLGTDESKLEHYPGVFTALGIAGTFLGILFALFKSIGGEVGQPRMGELLHGAGIAFITSIIGITFSLIFLAIERRVTGDFKSNLHKFQMAINSRLSRITQEKLLLEINDNLGKARNQELSQIVNALETMSDDIGAAVSKTVSETLTQIQKALENSVAIAGNSSQEIVTKVMGSIDGTIGRFGDISKKLEDSARLQNEVIINFEKSVNSTSELVDKFERILPSMVNISRDLAVSAERLEKLPDALQGLSKLQEEFTSVAKESVALMCTNWKEERERLTSLVEELQKQFSSFEKGIVNGIQTSMSKFDDELSRAGTYVTTWLDRLNDDVTKFTAQIGIFNGAVQNNTSELQKTLNEFNATITNQFIELNTQMTSTNTALRTSFQEIEQGFNRLPTEIDRAVGGVENVYRKATEQLPSMLASHLKEISDEMNKNTRKGFRLFGR